MLARLKGLILGWPPALLLIPVALTALAAWIVVQFGLITRLERASLDWDPVLLLAVMVLAGGAVGGFVHVVFSLWSKWLVGRRLLGEHHEIGNHFVGVVGVIYAVLVAFVVVTAWQARDRAVEVTMAEQNNVDDLFYLVSAYPGSDARTIRFMLRDYTMDTFGEWNQMLHQQRLCSDVLESDITCFKPQGAISRYANRLAQCIRERTFSLSPATPREQVIYQESIKIVQNLAENREERRLRYQQRTLQPILWWSFLLGAFILVGMTYFIIGQDPRSQLVRSAALFSTVGMMVALALVFDRPFAGRMQVPGEAWNVMAQHFDRDLDKKKSPYRGYPLGCD